MSLLTIDLVKKHLRVGFDDDDTEIAVYQAAAETIVTETLDREVYATGGSPSSGDDGTAIEITPPITAAILLLAGHLYEHREAVAENTLTELPMSVKYLLAPYRVWRTFDEDDATCES